MLVIFGPLPWPPPEYNGARCGESSQNCSIPRTQWGILLNPRPGKLVMSVCGFRKRPLKTRLSHQTFATWSEKKDMNMLWRAWIAWRPSTRSTWTRRASSAIRFNTPSDRVRQVIVFVKVPACHSTLDPNPSPPLPPSMSCRRGSCN